MLSKPGPRFALDPGIWIVMAREVDAINQPHDNGVYSVLSGVMQEKRYLCSDLFRIRGTGGWRGWANLEEIWRTGAVLESEQPIPLGQKLLLRKGKGKIWAAVADCQRHEWGFRVRLEFLFNAEWTPELFLPDHMLDPDQVRKRKTAKS